MSSSYRGALRGAPDGVTADTVRAARATADEGGACPWILGLYNGFHFQQGFPGRCRFFPQVFRQQAAKQQGLASESRGRYTEQDRPIMEHCWYLSQPYRQGLVSRAASSESASAEPRPSVLDLLKGGAVMQ